MAILYHGSNVGVREPQLLDKQRDLDFGKGFYTTSDRKQAESWALRKERIAKSGCAAVTAYELDERNLVELQVLRFERADEAWLDFVAANRTGVTIDREWDVVIGPVANDQTMPTILLYLDGYLSKQAAIESLCRKSSRIKSCSKRSKR